MLAKTSEKHVKSPEVEGLIILKVSLGGRRLCTGMQLSARVEAANERLLSIRVGVLYENWSLETLSRRN